MNRFMKLVCALLGVLVPAAAQADTHTYFVPGNRNESNPLSTALTIPARSLVTIRVTGTMTIGPGKTVVNGRGYWNNGFTRPNGMSFGAAVVVIAGVHWSTEGGARTFTAPHTGTVQIYIADTDPTDNTGGYTVSIDVGPQLIGDTDEDGLDDAFEDSVLNFFSPRLRFDDSEDAWPATVLWHARLSSVEPPAGCSQATTLPLIPQDGTPLMPFYPEWHLALSSPAGCASPWDERLRQSNVLNFAPFVDNSDIGGSGYAMGHDNNWRIGEGPARTSDSDGVSGMYGRVCKISYSGVPVLQLSYFHFYAYSDIDVTGPDIGAHEGDWEYMDLFVSYDSSNPNASLALPKLVGIKWWAHGGRIEWWRNGWSNGISAPFEGTTGQGTAHQGTFYDYQEEGAGGCVNRLGDWPVINTQHPEGYIQPHGHGFFPTAYRYKKNIEGFCVGNANAEGTGLRMTPLQVANVGEMYRPRLGMELVCNYGGRWGAESLGPNEPPDGPPLQAKHWPQRSAPTNTGNNSSMGPQREAIYLGTWDHGRADLPFGLTTPIGRISWPYQNFGSAVDAATSHLPSYGQALVIYPGQYHAQGVLITQPLTIKTPHGGVIIGLDP